MRILGVDPGSRVTGYGVVEPGGKGRLVHVANGEVKAKAGLPLAERLHSIWTSLTGVMEEHRPGAVAVESVFYARNVKSAIMLGHARGVALAAAASFGINVFEYSPKTIKQAVAGYGGASKDQVQKMVSALLGIKALGPKNTDASDALAVAICHIHTNGFNRAARAGTL